MTTYTTETAIAHLQQTDDLSLRYYAAWWLGKFRVTDPTAITALLTALEDESDRSPDGGYPLRRNAARALGKLQDSQAVSLLIQNLNCTDYYVREACAQALEEIGDPQAIPHLRNLLAGGVEAAQPVPGKPHLVQPYEAVIEALGTLGATDTTSELAPFLDHPVAKVQLATARALYQLTKEDIYGKRLVEGLKAEKLPLRRSALMDLGATDYLKAASAIAQTPAENSLKLISLKGLLENHLQHQNHSELSEDAINLLTLMDSLL
ncbi:PBS lyase HEAT domain protein repeat-containing protein [Halothece sp. PCC 7418]|uniref:HEAT repeat domain-containing protein n=1 Tax=Halothece sp. (strain PCC 7418) TaxID=65093 RepID=UPI0002A07198|nr:HEAT repeat domain-containing protein [Halothece sp. PCC 7418]AFZ44617.1 PBS lyase HEAT domain protein repeat-containing protein [Halothece sp. PCC 7418]